MRPSIEADRPAASDCAVVFCCDANFLPFALMAATQIADISAARDFDIVLATMGPPLAIPPAFAARGLRSVRIDAAGAFDGLMTDKRRNVSAYIRLALPDAFATEYRRLLYLDSDVFVQGGDFGQLLRVDLHGRPVAAVRDNQQWRSPRRMPSAFRTLGLGRNRYFNSGLILMDVKELLTERTMARAVELGQRFAGLDQDLLNAVLHGEWAELSPAWNWQYTWASRLFETLADPNVIHFIGNKKPWTHAGGALPLRFRRAYRAFLEAHFPDRVLPGDGPSPMRDRRYVYRLLLKHLAATRSFTAYLDRFEDDLTVLP
jgi:hypothetical protein